MSAYCVRKSFVWSTVSPGSSTRQTQFLFEPGPLYPSLSWSANKISTQNRTVISFAFLSNSVFSAVPSSRRAYFRLFLAILAKNIAKNFGLVKKMSYLLFQAQPFGQRYHLFFSSFAHLAFDEWVREHGFTQANHDFGSLLRLSLSKPLCWLKLLAVQ